MTIVTNETQSTVDDRKDESPNGKEISEKVSIQPEFEFIFFSPPFNSIREPSFPQNLCKMYQRDTKEIQSFSAHEVKFIQQAKETNLCRSIRYDFLFIALK